MRRLSSLALILSFAYAGCGGGGHSSSLPPVNQAAVPSAKGTASVTVTLTIPPKTAAALARRTPQTVSSATQSVGIAINGAAPQAFNCTSPTCSATVIAPVGNDTFVISTYSGPSGGGAILDQVTTNFVVAPGGPNNLSVTLGPVVSNTQDSGEGSLRQAIVEANPGDTITFIIPLPATITPLTPIAVSQSVTIAGPGASQLTFNGNNATELFNVRGGVTATISGATLTGGKADEGGAIYNQGTLTLTSDTFTANSSGTGGGPSYYGGAIYSDGTLTIANSTFTNNTNPQPNGYGGAIYQDSGGTLTITNSTFSGNSAQYGGAIYNEVPATLTGDTFSANVSAGQSEDPEGGAIYSDGDMTISGSTFTNNSANATGGGNTYNYGGAIYVDDCNDNGLSVTSSTFTGNSVGGAAAYEAFGGAIYDDSDCNDSQTNVTFTNNTAAGTYYTLGGAIYFDSEGVLTTSGNVTFSGNTATATNSSESYAGGGAIEMYEYSGGSLCLGESGGECSGVSGSVTTFTNNTVTSPYEAYGGAIDNQSGGYFSFYGTATFNTNSAVASGSTAGSAYGGALEYYNDGDDCCSVARKPSGHGLKQPAAARHTPTRGPNAKAKRQHAAATIVRTTQSNPKYTWDQASFTGNVAQGGSSSGDAYGGAIDFEDYEGVCITIPGGTVSGNVASASFSAGGAVAVEEGMLTIQGATATGNKATNEGGAFWNDGNLTLTNVTISGNQVTNTQSSGDGGGGIWNEYDLYVNSSTVSGNSTAGTGGVEVGTGGGGIYTSDYAQFNDSTITGNSTSVDGGGIYVGPTDGTTDAYFNNVTVYQNSATGKGGSVRNNSGYVYPGNSIFAGGSATGGGAEIQNDGTWQSEDYNITQGTVANTGTFSGAPHDLGGTNPLLLPLANNGGPTQTNADQANSPGKGYIPFVGPGCNDNNIYYDQRGYTRGAGGVCDVGAYEFSGQLDLSSKLIRH